MKANILIVENEAILYERLRRLLVKNNYAVCDFTKSVNEALDRINNKKPDLALLDIDLDGELTGIDLGKILSEKYNIPFIYVTSYDDNDTFYRGLHTNHEDFIIKTKPRIDPDKLLRSIQTVLYRNREKKQAVIKNGVLGLLGYLNELKSFSKNEITKIPVKFEDISFFSIDPFINENNEPENVKTNYLWFLTKKKEHFFLKSSLKELNKNLPKYFIRVNESYIVNLLPEHFNGRIIGNKLSIKNHEITIKDSFAYDLKQKLRELYHIPKK